jgi:hypothetical protein
VMSPVYRSLPALPARGIYCDWHLSSSVFDFWDGGLDFGDSGLGFWDGGLDGSGEMLPTGATGMGLANSSPCDCGMPKACKEQRNDRKHVKTLGSVVIYANGGTLSLGRVTGRVPRSSF